jgi:hypothetical protein
MDSGAVGATASCALEGDGGYFEARLAGSGSPYSRAVVSKAPASGASRRAVPETVPGPGRYHVVVRSDCPWQVSVTTA